MKTWQKIGLVTLAVLLIVGLRVYFIWRERHTSWTPKTQVVERRLTADDIVQPRKLYIDDLGSARTLNGKNVWVQAGYELDYYPYTEEGRVDFGHKVGVLPAAQPLKIEDMITERVPANLSSRIPLGDHQVFAVFHFPNNDQDYATAVGYLQGNDSKYYCDDVFYYDDPHLMYKHWPADIWQAVDQHQPKPGMNELQTAMALGVIQQSDSSSYGNRIVHYDAGGKKWAVTFQNDKATAVQQE